MTLIHNTIHIYIYRSTIYYIALYLQTYQLFPWQVSIINLFSKTSKPPVFSPQIFNGPEVKGPSFARDVHFPDHPPFLFASRPEATNVQRLLLQKSGEKIPTSYV